VQNYVFYLIDDAELLEHDPGPDALHTELEEWSIRNGAHWGELRQRAGFLWEAIDRLDTTVPSELRFKERISEAEIGPRWGSIQGVGYFPAPVAEALGNAIAPLVDAPSTALRARVRAAGDLPGRRLPRRPQTQDGFRRPARLTSL
jgi:hypothetical protein